MDCTPMEAHRKFLPGFAIALQGLLLCGLVQAAGLTVGPGATYSLGSGTTSLGCGDLDVAGTLNLDTGSFGETASVLLSGTLNADSGVITLGNDWNNTGTFNAGSSQVTVNDDCGDGVSLFQGDAAFSNLTVTTATGKTWSLTAGSTQNVANALELTGQPGNLLTIRSTSAGTPAFLELAAEGSQQINYVDVQDNHALGPPGQWLAPGFPSDYNSVDSGGNDRWFGLGTARFEVDKVFSDDNPAGVEVTIDCNTGLPLEQSRIIDRSSNVTFVVTDFDTEDLRCEITESPVPAGYEASYNNGLAVVDDVSCVYDEVNDQGRFTCTITNELQPVEVEVTKIWQESNPESGLPTDAEARWECFNTQEQTSSGWLSFSGTEDSDSFTVLPHWDGTTYCRVEESGLGSDVEVDDSDCENVAVTPGAGNTCTIYNVRFFEGIPTLNMHGLALLALLMLGLGWAGLRRFG